MENNLEGIEKLKDLLCSDGLISFEMNKEGAFFKDNILCLGLIVGPHRDISGVTHEISHFVEMEDKRLITKPNNWGFHFPKIELYGKLYHNFLTPTATLREIRTIAFQYNLEHHLKVNEQSPYDAISSLFYMPDFTFVSFDEKVKEEFQKVPSNKLASDRARLKWCEEKLMEFIKMEMYSFDNFMIELERKKKLILQP